MSMENIEKIEIKKTMAFEEIIEKIVKAQGNSGRVYLPPKYVGRRVVIIIPPEEEY